MSRAPAAQLSAHGLTVSVPVSVCNSDHGPAGQHHAPCAHTHSLRRANLVWTELGTAIKSIETQGKWAE